LEEAMNAPTPPPAAKKGRKYDQVLDGARDVFLQDGFEGASVDEIARSAGVSKATLYSYFPDKRLLFMEVATRECGRQSDNALQQIDQSRPPRPTCSTSCCPNWGAECFASALRKASGFPSLGRSSIAVAQLWCGPR
jgi:AcrR family transcriptional regulator